MVKKSKKAPLTDQEQVKAYRRRKWMGVGVFALGVVLFVGGLVTLGATAVPGLLIMAKVATVVGVFGIGAGGIDAGGIDARRASSHESSAKKRCVENAEKELLLKPASSSTSHVGKALNADKPKKEAASAKPVPCDRVVVSSRSEQPVQPGGSVLFPALSQLRAGRQDPPSTAGENAFYEGFSSCGHG